MVRNYIKIAWRSIVKNRFFSFLNIFGLAISLAVAILLMTYGREELSFNKHFTKEANLYRVNMLTTAEFKHEKWVELPNAVGPTMLDEIPEVEAMARLVRFNFSGSASVRANQNNFSEKNIYLTDASLFQLFDFKFLEGDLKGAFQHPKSVIISLSRKEKLFGDQQAIGEQIIFDQNDTLTVSAVFQDLPLNSTLDGDIFANIMDSWMGTNVYWSNASYETYCLLRPTAQVDDVEKKASALIAKHVPEENQYYTQFFLQPLAKIHLYSTDLRHGVSSRTGDVNTVRTVFILSFLIIAIACINYMNLATARSQKNTKEVGINKVLGAKQAQIKVRFYLETAIVAFISIMLGLLIASLLLSVFNKLVDTAIDIPALLQPENIGIMVGIWILITLVGGSYPAFYMAKMPSLSLMKKWTSKNRLSENIRRGLVVFQFTCSIVLIIGVIIISLQMRHVHEKDLGYEPSHILTIPIRAINSLKHYDGIKESVRSLAGTESLATLQAHPGGGESNKNIKHVDATNDGLPVRTCSSYGNVIPTLGLDLLAGGDLPEYLPKGDTTCYVLINEVVAAYLGYTDPSTAIGRPVKTEMAAKSIIVGVVRNFNFLSLKDAIGGYVYYRSNRPTEFYNELLIKYAAQDLPAYVQKVQAIFEKELPEVAFDYQFLDSYVQQQYSKERRTNDVITVFSVLTIFVACLGLFGLAAFTAEQRKKEIGVRKVLGASIYRIAHLLSSHFFILIILSLLIASPIAWWIFSEWLQSFNDRVSIPWWSFLVAGLFSLGIAIATIGYQALRAATANPVDSLRDE